MDVDADSLIASRYRLERRLSSAASGEVWEATDEVLGRRVAVRLLRAELASDDSMRERFRTEAKAAARLTHPAVAGVYDYGEVESGQFLVTELVEGEPLRSVLTRSGPLGAAHTMGIVAQVASVLAAAHSTGVAHRSVKLENLLLCDGRVKIADNFLTRRAAASGSAADHATRCASTDVHQLGEIALECLGDAGTTEGLQASVDADRILAALPHVPVAVRHLVARLLDVDPSIRPASLTAIAAEAEHLRDAAPSDGVRPPPPVPHLAGKGTEAHPARGRTSDFVDPRHSYLERRASAVPVLRLKGRRVARAAIAALSGAGERVVTSPHKVG